MRNNPFPFPHVIEYARKTEQRKFVHEELLKQLVELQQRLPKYKIDSRTGNLWRDRSHAILKIKRMNPAGFKKHYRLDSPGPAALSPGRSPGPPYASLEASACPAHRIKERSSNKKKKSSNFL